MPNMTVWFNVENGQSLVELKLRKSASYLSFKKPLTFIWAEGGGSIDKYFTVFSFSKEYREAVHVPFIESLNDGTFSIENSKEALRDVLILFEKGNYLVHFEPAYKHEITDGWHGYELAFNRMLYSSNKIIREERRSWGHGHGESDLRFVSEQYYDGFCETFVFTQPVELLNYDRVEFYKDLILSGRRPFAIIYSGKSETRGSDWSRTHQTANFILDGHHKLWAYNALKILPALIRIEKIYPSDDHMNFTDDDFESELEPRLQHCQVNHFRKKIIKKDLGTG